MKAPRPRIVAATELARGLTDLEPAYRQVFPGDRHPTWYADKIHREVVRPELSFVALNTEGRVIAFAMLGAPPSLGGAARSIAIGVVEGHRGRGLGGRTLRRALEAAAKAGAAAVHTTAHPDLVAFYDGLGYREVGLEAHLVHPGQATAARSFDTLSPEPSDLPLPGDAQLSWHAEAWLRTERSRRRRFQSAQVPAGEAGLTREHAGWLMQWWTPSAALPDLAGEALEHVATGDRLFIYGVDARPGGPMAKLLRAGWRAAQLRSRLLWRPRAQH